VSSIWKTDYNSGDIGKTSSFKITPGIGYFLFKNFLVGIDFSLDYYHQKDNGKIYKETTTALSPFLRLYIGDKKVKPFINGAAGPGWIKTKSEYNGNTSEQKSRLSGYEAGGGLAFFLSDGISLDLSIAYASATSKFTDGSNVKWENTAKGFGSNFGFSMYF